MSATLIDGRAAREAIVPKLIERVRALSYAPVLAIIQIGDRPDSTAFIAAKKSFAKKIGIAERHIQLPASSTQDKLVETIRACNADALVRGIILQLPIPASIDRDAALDAIDPRKDVDGLTSHNVKRWLQGVPGAVLPATARGIRELFIRQGVSLAGKRVAIVGRSTLVGKPIAAMCLDENATVTIAHSKTADLSAVTKPADILIVAAGRPGLIRAEHVRAGQIVIDVGINTVTGEKLEEEIPRRKLVGDVDFDAVKDIVAAITPVPGGVGPMTVCALFENMLDLC